MTGRMMHLPVLLALFATAAFAGEHPLPGRLVAGQVRYVAEVDSPAAALVTISRERQQYGPVGLDFLTLDQLVQLGADARVRLLVRDFAANPEPGIEALLALHAYRQQDFAAFSRHLGSAPGLPGLDAAQRRYLAAEHARVSGDPETALLLADRLAAPLREYALYNLLVDVSADAALARRTSRALFSKQARNREQQALHDRARLLLYQQGLAVDDTFRQITVDARYGPSAVHQLARRHQQAGDLDQARNELAWLAGRADYGERALALLDLAAVYEASDNLAAAMTTYEQGLGVLETRRQRLWDLVPSPASFDPDASLPALAILLPELLATEAFQDTLATWTRLAARSDWLHIADDRLMLLAAVDEVQRQRLGETRQQLEQSGATAVLAATAEARGDIDVLLAGALAQTPSATDLLRFGRASERELYQRLTQLAAVVPAEHELAARIRRLQGLVTYEIASTLPQRVQALHARLAGLDDRVTDLTAIATRISTAQAHRDTDHGVSRRIAGIQDKFGHQQIALDRHQHAVAEVLVAAIESTVAQRVARLDVMERHALLAVARLADEQLLAQEAAHET